ncbi:MAG: hypothetical protein ACI80I_000844 [Akkermansiaceae bacterium]|jgi:hypothetical protein
MRQNNLELGPSHRCKQRLPASGRYYNEERPHSAIRNKSPIMLVKSEGDTSQHDRVAGASPVTTLYMQSAVAYLQHYM